MPGISIDTGKCWIIIDNDLILKIEYADQNQDEYNNDMDIDFSEFDLTNNAEDDEGFTPISKLIAKLW